jgi:hypothetical protein
MLKRLELESFESMYKDRVFKVPQVFRDDKEVMLKIVSKSSASLIHASDILKNDRDVVLAAIQNEQPCAPLAIRHASKKLQADKKIARVVLGHGHGIKALSLLPRSIQQDCNLVLQAIQWSCDECNKSYETLSKLAEEMLDDYDIVYEAVKRRGSNLQYVTDKSLLEDIDIVMAAWENDGAAIQYIPDCPARDEMLEEHNLIVLVENCGHCVLKELDEKYIMDRKYLLVAVKNGMIVPEDVSLKLYEQDRPLFNDVLRHSSKPLKQYEAFPESIREQDANVGTDILKTNTSFDEESWAFRFAREIPKDDMQNHIESLMKMARCQYTYPGGDFWDVKSIVVSLCNINGDYFANVSTRLCADIDVVKAAFGSGRVGVRTIKKVPQTLYQANHDIAALAVSACTDESPNWGDRSSIFHHFGPQVTSCKLFFLAWVQRGWSVRNHYGRLLPFADDHSVILEAIKIAKNGSVSQIFAGLPGTLREDKEFMMKAVEANPRVIKEANADILQDFGYLLHGIAASKASLLYFTHKDKDFDLIADFAAEVRNRLFFVDTVLLHFFGSISTGGNKRAKRRRTGRKRDNCPLCQLHLLEIGGEGGEWIKRNIAQFADIPVGSDLKLFRSAIENLEYWGY